MKICLIGQNLTNFIIASLLAEKKLHVDLIYNKKINYLKSKRTIAISSKNFAFVNDLVNKSLPCWHTNEIKIFTEKFKDKEILNFSDKNKEVFNLVNYSKMNSIFYKKIKDSKYISLKKSNSANSQFIKKLSKYDLVINSENKNVITQQYFSNKLKKNYDSIAYTFIINHKKIINRTASQIFTKFGPLAFLPLSNSKTSIVFSFSGKEVTDDLILKVFNQYNFFYDINDYSGIEKFNLYFLMPRKYIHKNILIFGDLLHRIHPLAGQGFNMTIRDIQILSNIIDKKINLGLPIDITVAEDFQKSMKHFNYLYGKGIDSILEFFNLDNKLNNSISKSLFDILNKNYLFKKYTKIFSDSGIKI